LFGFVLKEVKPVWKLRVKMIGAPSGLFGNMTEWYLGVPKIKEVQFLVS